MNSEEIKKLVDLLKTIPSYGSLGDKGYFVLGYCSCLKQNGIGLNTSEIAKILTQITTSIRSGELTEENSNLLYAHMLVGDQSYVNQYIENLQKSMLRISFQPEEIKEPILPIPQVDSVDTQTKELIKKLVEDDLKAPVPKKREEKAKCEICLDFIIPTAYIPLDKCGHLFHKECIQKYLISRIESKTLPITCPKLNCKTEISYLDLKEFLNKEMLALYEQYSFKKLLSENPDDYSCCPTPDCSYVFSYIKGTDLPEFTCPLCKYQYCLDCQCVMHKGMTCKEYQLTHTFTHQDAQFQKFVKGMKYKQCPKCKYWISKVSGCDHMSCRCGMQFCYHCGNGYPCNCQVKKAPAKKKYHYH
jgi:E3 ubiquitin-protein ligase RNF144